MEKISKTFNILIYLIISQQIEQFVYSFAATFMYVYVVCAATDVELQTSLGLTSSPHLFSPSVNAAVGGRG